MRSYRIINDYKIVNRVTIEDLKSNLYYIRCVDEYTAICFAHIPPILQGTGYMRLLEEAFVFEEDDIIPYIYE